MVLAEAAREGCDGVPVQVGGGGVALPEEGEREVGRAGEGVGVVLPVVAGQAVEGLAVQLPGFGVTAFVGQGVGEVDGRVQGERVGRPTVRVRASTVVRPSRAAARESPARRR